MKIAFLTNRTDKPSFRFRISEYLPSLEKEGFKSDIFLLSKSLIKRIKTYRKLKKYDCVFLHRSLLSLPDIYLLKKHSSKLIFDFDDAIIYNDPNKTKLISSKKKSRFKQTIKRTDIIIAGNEYLKNLVEPYTHKTCIIPTPVNTKYFTPKNDGQNKENIIIGWLGSASTLIYLKDIIDVLDKLYLKYKNIELKIVANDFIESKNIPIIKKQWSQDDEASDLHSFDIGIMPLRNDPWSEGKCGFKLIQYLSCAVPAVCSPVGINKTIIQHDYNGLLASNKDEWIKQLSILIEDKPLREKLAHNGLKIIEDKFSIKANLPILLKLLND